MLKFSTVLLFAIILSACNEKSTKNISTGDAYEKYSYMLKDKLFFAFPEERDNPLKWFDSIPVLKLQKIIRPEYFTMKASPGEIFVFQIGVWALSDDVKDLSVEFSDLKGRNRIISSSKVTCYNLGGTDFMGKAFKKQIGIPRNRLQDLWIVVDLDSVVTGTYRGSVTILSGGAKQVVPVAIRVKGNTVKNHGYDEGSHLSRLNWLNSTVGTDENVTKGFLPVNSEGSNISILGRSMKLDENGLPSSIISYFGPSNQSLVEKGEELLSKPFRFIVEKESGELVRLTPDVLTFGEKTASKVSWKVVSSSPDFDLELSGQMEFDGFIAYKLKLISKNKVRINDIRLEIPVVKEKAAYMMGLGHEGGIRASDWRWKWDTAKNQDMVWLGAVNGGIRLKLKAENYVRPLINVYYKFGPLKLPSS
ncbi:MAG: hypothetical protein IPJ37_01555 [Bacteroidales bacterium]|nr:hypothetical protein [Bacteroidales bacterium]